MRGRAGERANPVALWPWRFRACPLAPRGRRGFTVLELVLVLTVLVVAAAAVVPGFPAFARGQRLRGTAGRLAGVVRYALQWSREHTREVILFYDEGERCFRLEVVEEAEQLALADLTPAEDLEEEEPPQLNESRANLRLPEDVELERAEVAGEPASSAGIEVRFTADGQCDDCAFLLRAGEARCTVSVAGRRGRVLVEEGDGLEAEVPGAVRRPE
ncbi:MAG: prepilin-type N-terminal cleavage/methylation domain-containing protein [Armatimonadetes bacterium]|jgi:prepilin-type N-terminal cleavage/methylation domain-containing protein|nr:prepilin-type N-terminal cleavage/methylation domain-containing protein [Armatimonadota bacterium]